MKPIDSLHSIKYLEAGTHLCWICETEEEHRRLLTPFLNQGLVQNEKVLYLADTHTPEMILDYLRSAGIKVEPYLESGQLKILTASDVYIYDNDFKPDEMISFLSNETEQALTEGYTALRVTGEMSWALKNLHSIKRLIEYEVKLNEFFLNSKCQGICLYHRQNCSPEILLKIISNHPIVVVDSEVIDNNYYLAPADFSGKNRSEIILRKWLENLSSQKRIEGELKESIEKYRSLADNTMDGIVIVEGDMIKFVNQKMLEMFGCQSDDLMVDRKFIDFVSPEYRNQLMDMGGFGEKNERTPSHFEFKALRMDGTAFDAELSESKIVFDGCTARQGILKDVTNRKEIDETAKLSSTQWETTFNAIKNGVCLTDAEGTILQCNKTMMDLFVKPINEIVGKTCKELIDGTAIQIKEYPIDQMKKTLRRVTMDLSIGDKLFSVTADPILDANRRLVGAVYIMADITERKLSKLREKQYIHDLKYLSKTAMGFVGLKPDAKIYQHIATQLKKLIGNSIVIVNSFDPKTDVCQLQAILGLGNLSEAVIKILGKEPIGTTYKITEEARRQLITGKYHKVPGKMYTLSFRQIPKPICRVLERLFGIREIHSMGFTWEGELLGNVVIILRKDTDLKNQKTIETFINQAAVVLQRRRAEEELQEYHKHLEDLVEERTKQLEETNAELEAFAYSVSHDLRAPLRGMQGFAQVLLEDYQDKFDVDGKEFARRIIDASQHMNIMIENLLEYSRLSRMEMRLRSVSLNKVVKEVIKQLEPEINEKKAKITVEPSLPDVRGNNTTLMKVITNLLINALMFVAPGVKPKVKIWSKELGGRILLFVEDNGIGIDPKYQEKIFRIFERLHGIETYPGTGIGLAIVRKGIARMDGKVGVESTLGKGTKFWIELAKVSKIDDGKK